MKTLNFINRWTLPKRYCGAHWDRFYSFLGQSRDSSCLERANFDAGLKAIKEVASKESIPGEDMRTVQVMRENHWALGWVEWIAIHESDVAALELADTIKEKLEDYPVVDESLFSEYETDDANETWQNCFNPVERVEYIRQHRGQFEFLDFADMMQCVRGKYFAGYASELIN
jgi:hypothetical protein